jgi:hypothetical protein
MNVSAVEVQRSQPGVWLVTIKGMSFTIGRAATS